MKALHLLIFTCLLGTLSSNAIGQSSADAAVLMAIDAQAEDLEDELRVMDIAEIVEERAA